MYLLCAVALVCFLLLLSSELLRKCLSSVNSFFPFLPHSHPSFLRLLIPVLPGYPQICYVDKFAHLQLLILFLPPNSTSQVFGYRCVLYNPRYSLEFQTGSWRVIEVIYAPSFTHDYYHSLIQSCRTPWVLCFLLIG